jgi:phosphosulfolactate phosphohydrolase-like enzyme
MEDLLGVGAVIAELEKLGAVELENDVARLAVKLFEACREELPTVLSETYGGHNIRRVKLDADIAFAARLNLIDVVGRVVDRPLRVVRE